jgi:hypothetical protein
MLTVLSAGLTGSGSGTGVMFELYSVRGTGEILHSGGWTMLTAVNLMLFSLLHNPCSRNQKHKMDTGFYLFARYPWIYISLSYY